MSLDELLRDAEKSSTWNTQRQKLIRLGLGLGLATAGLVGGTVLLLTLKKPHAPAREVAAAEQDKEAGSLAQLMRLQKAAAALKADAANVRGVSAAIGRTYHARATREIVNYDPGEGFNTLVKAKTDVYIPTGAVFQAQLVTPIKTSVEKTFVMAETTREYRMDQKRRILKGSHLIGTSRLNPTLKGVIVEFNTLVSPSGIETSLNSLALSRNALPEIEGLYFSNKLVSYGSALAFGFLSGFADAARDREYTAFGSTPVVSPANDALTGFSTASFQVANEVLSDIRGNAIEYVVVPAGEQIFVALTRRYEIDQGVPR